MGLKGTTRHGLAQPQQRLKHALTLNSSDFSDGLYTAASAVRAIAEAPNLKAFGRSRFSTELDLLFRFPRNILMLLAV